MGDPRQIGPKAPTGLLQFDIDGWVGRGCDDCLAWQAMVHIDEQDRIWALERHAIGCPTYQHYLPQFGVPDEE